MYLNSKDSIKDDDFCFFDSSYSYKNDYDQSVMDFFQFLSTQNFKSFSAKW